MKIRYVFPFQMSFLIILTHQTNQFSKKCDTNDTLLKKCPEVLLIYRVCQKKKDILNMYVKSQIINIFFGKLD